MKHTFPRFLVVILTACVFTIAASAQSGTWAVTGPIAKYASGPSSSLMFNGKVLTAGGNLGGIGAVFPWAQVYDPASNSWKATVNMKSGRNGLSGTTLPDGQVLLVGGSSGGNGNNLIILNTAELYDPTSGTFRMTTGKMTTPRMGQTATLLPNGKVLIVGGMNVYNIAIRWGSCTDLAELYDPTTRKFSAAGKMSSPRCGHTATLMQNGKVLVAGGGYYRTTLASAELYDPATNSWSLTGSLNSARSGHAAVLLQDGRVLVAGASATSELYDPASGTWSLTGSTATTYSGNSAVLLTNGKVLIVGGPAGQCELYNPASGTWTATGSLNYTRFGFGLSLLSDGRVLVSDGQVGYLVGSAEIYTP